MFWTFYIVAIWLKKLFLNLALLPLSGKSMKVLSSWTIRGPRCIAKFGNLCLLNQKEKKKAVRWKVASSMPGI
jgi:hypothetical protein